MVKNLPGMWETWVQSLGWEDPLEKGMATHSSILAWRIPWAEEPGGLQSVGSQRVGHDWATNTHTIVNLKGVSRCHYKWDRKWTVYQSLEWRDLFGSWCFIYKQKKSIAYNGNLKGSKDKRIQFTVTLTSWVSVESRTKSPNCCSILDT